MLLQVVTDVSMIVTLLIGMTILVLMKHYMDIRKYPPGPLPLPFIGSLLKFRNKRSKDVFQQLREQYGDVYTIWLGTQKTVVVSGYPLIREGLIDRKFEFAGRPDNLIIRMVVKGNDGITVTDLSPQWEVLRKMTHVAIRKFAVSDRLPKLIDEIVQENVHRWVSSSEPIDGTNYIYFIIFNIIMSSLTGERFRKDNVEYQKFVTGQRTFQLLTGNGLLSDWAPILRPFYLHREWKITRAVDDMHDFVVLKLREHEASYKSGVIRDLMDSLLSARKEIMAEGKEAANHLHEGNMVVTIFDLITAAIATSEATIRWSLLYLATYTHMQNRVRDELREQIGNNMPVLEDRKRCPYTCAVIAEAMRIRPVVPFGTPHKTTKDTELGGFRIPRNTQVLFHVETAHLDEQKWKDPDVFRPERFLNDNNEFTTERVTHFLPFSQGRRSCIGEKLATADVFMVLSGILLRCRIALDTPPEDLQAMDLGRFRFPKAHKIVAQTL